MTSKSWGWVRRTGFLLLLVLAAAVTIRSLGPEARVKAASVNWTLVWSDEFDGAFGSSPDPARWVPETGGHGWGNAELQNYTARPENVRVEDGNLVIEARREDFGGNAYTSARLKTQGTFDQTYGKFEARLKLPRGQGIWPAFWMLGSNIVDVGWPSCGEIDIMEHINHDLRIVGSLHGPGYNGGSALNGQYAVPDTSYFDSFHTYAVEWGPDVAYWYVDSNLYSVKSIHDVPLGASWAFNDHPFFVLLNLAVGGQWPGPPDSTTVFPQRYLVDYVRVYAADGPLDVPPPPTPPPPGPFHGVPAAIPGLIQAEDFDFGGEGVAYHDSDVSNNGGAYRPRESVDIGGSGDLDGGPAVGWAGAGEWLTYAVHVAQSDGYTLEARVASDGVGGTFHVEMDGVDVTGPVSVPNTGGWGSWRTITKALTLSAGTGSLRLVLDANGPSGAVANFNWLRFRADNPAPIPPGPWNAAPAAIPGTVQSEEYDRGGEGVAYHDLDASNNGNEFGNTFRADEAVDIGLSFDDGTHSVGWVGAGEWLEYAVDVLSGGPYSLEARVASDGPGGSFHVELDGIDVSGSLTVPNTGGWTTWQTVSRDLSLPPGRHTLRLAMDTNGATGGIGNFNYLRFTALTPGDTVGVWVTTGDRGKLLEQQPNVSFGPDSGGNPLTIDVNPAVTYQTMDGFGASFSDSSAWLVWTKLGEAERNQLMERLFDPVKGIGLSFIRQPISASDFALGNYTYDDTCCDLGDFSIDHDRAYILPVLKQAKALNPALKLMGTPWSAPGWMKTSGQLAGGSLRPEYYDELAQFFVKYVQAYAAEGLPIDYITPNNEPLLEIGYPSMRLEAGAAVDLIKNHLGPALQAAGLSTGIVMWDHNWDNPAYPLEVLADPAAKGFVAGSAFHCYAGNVNAQTAVRDAHPDKGIWFTECSSGAWSPSFAVNLRNDVRGLIIGATRNWAKSVVKWNLALDESYGPRNGGCPNCTGVVTVAQSNGAITFTHEYYALGHASRFVVPGAVRIGSNTFGSNAVEDVAFLNPDGSKVLIVVNTSLGDRTFHVREAGQSFAYSLPGGAVATFKWPGPASPTPPLTPPPAPAPLNQPYGGAAWTLPGTIQAEDYDEGGRGVAYADNDAGNNGGAYRTDDVDVEATGDAGGGYNVGWTGVGEWLKYTVDVAADGLYDFNLRVAAMGSGSVLLEVDGIDAIGAVPVPDTGGWQSYRTVTRHGVSLAAGRHVLRLIFATGTTGNVNWLSLTAAGPAVDGPFGGAPWPIPGIVQAEDFNTGGVGVSYVDSDPSNNGGAYRLDEQVDLENTVDAGLPAVGLGWTAAGEWTSYSVNVTESALYSVQVRVASQGQGGTFHVEVDGNDLTGRLTVPDTGGWNVWQTLAVDAVLSAGPHLLTLVMDTEGPVTNSVGNFNYLQFSVGGPVPTPTPPPSTPYHGTPVSLPGVVQSEEFDRGGEGVAYHDSDGGNNGGQFRPTEAVDIEATTDTGGGYDVGWTGAGEWLKYSVRVTATGSYTIDARVATFGQGNPGGTFHLEVDGTDVTGPLVIPDTGWWQNWTTISKAGVPLTAGNHLLRLVLDAGGVASFGNFNYLQFRLPPPPPGPYGGAPAPIPGTVEAELYDHGGEGVAYHDLDPTNNGAQFGVEFRPTEGVDIGLSGDTEGGYSVGWVGAGEWLNYTVAIASPGVYTWEARVASDGVGGTFHLEVDGVKVAQALAVPSTGGWTTWQTVTGVATLPAGVHTLRLVMACNGPTNGIGNFNYLRFTAGGTTPPAPGPYTGTPVVIPGVVEAELFDHGGEGVAYHDLDPCNNNRQFGATFRLDEGVDTGDAGDVDGGYSIGWTAAGEWLKYAVTVKYTGTYRLDARVASDVPGGIYHLEVDGADVTGPLGIPDTGGWTTWQTLSHPGIPLTAGQHVLRLVMDTDGPAGVGNINRFTFTREDTEPPVLKVSASPERLKPDKRRLVEIDVRVKVRDDQDRRPDVVLESITCDDRCRPSEDIVGARYGQKDTSFRLRAEQRGRDPRTYTIKYSATDDAGNRTTATTRVRVSSHNSHNSHDSHDSHDSRGKSR